MGSATPSQSGVGKHKGIAAGGRPGPAPTHETHHWGYFLRTKPSNEDYFFERRKVLNCSNAFVVAVLLQTLR